MKVQIILVALGAAVFSGCASMSSMQTARTLKEGDSRHTIGGGTYSSKSKIGDIEYESNLPYVEYSYRRGFAENLDAGLKLTFIGTYAADAKYQLINGEKFALAVGGGLGYMSYKTKSGDLETDVKYLDFMVPIYLSYDFTPGFSVYTTPRYVFRSASGEGAKNDSIVGAALGTKIGEKSGVIIEAAMAKGKDDTTLTQYNIGYFW